MERICELTGIHERTVCRHLDARFKQTQEYVDNLSTFERVEVGVLSARGFVGQAWIKPSDIVAATVEATGLVRPVAFLTQAP